MTVATVADTRATITAPLDFQLTSLDPVTNVITPIDLTGMTAVDLHLRNPVTKGVKVFTQVSGKITILNALLGQVRFAPSSVDLIYEQPSYDAWFMLTTGTGTTLSVPSGSNFKLNVVGYF